MIDAIMTHLAGDRLRKLWARLSERQQPAVREAPHVPSGVFDRRQFEAKYGSLPAGLGATTTRARACVVRFFLYPASRHALEATILEADDVWRLDRDKLLSAIESGHDPDELRKFLAIRDDQPLPETVEGFLRDTERGARALTMRTTSEKAFRKAARALGYGVAPAAAAISAKD